MRFARSGIALIVVLGLSALFLTWQARGQTSALPTPGSFGNNPFGMGQGAIRDPELRKLINEETTAAQEVAAIVAEYGKIKNEKDREKAKTKLSAALTKQFDAQQKRRELELARVEAQLKKLRELMKKRDDERKTIIEKRLDQLVREAEGLGWTPPPGPRAPAGFGASVAPPTPR